MASGNLTDFNFNSNSFADTFRGVFTTKLGLLNGLMDRVPNGVVANKGGYYLNIPQFKSLSADTTQITLSSTATLNAVGDFNTILPWVEREVHYSTDQIVPLLASKDPTDAAAQMMAEYAAIQVQKWGISAIKGAFATALASSHSYNDSGNTINVAGINAARLKLGDNLEELKEAIMNSKVYIDAVNDKLATSTLLQNDATFSSGVIRELLGMRTSLVDSLTVDGTTYSSYFGAKGSVIYDLRIPKTSMVNNANVYNLGDMGQIEIYRIPGTAGGQDVVALRLSLAVGVYGTAYQTGSGSNPSQTTLETGSSWAVAANDNKLVKIVEYKSN